MAMKTKSRRKKERYRSIGSFAVLGVVCIVFAASTIGGISLRQKNKSYQAREEALEASLAEETARTQELEELEAYMQTKSYVEEVAKDKLGLVYEDEIIFKAN